MLALLSALAAAAPPPTLAADAPDAAQRAYAWETVARCGAADGGTLSAELSVSDGAVTAVVVTDGTIPPEAQDCTLAAIATWRFPAAVSGAVSVPLVYPPAPPPLTEAEIATIGRVLHRNAPQLRACYERALLADASLSGSLSVLVWLEGGAVAASHATGSMQDTPLAGCLQRRLASWTFPLSITGELELPLAMTPAG